MRINVFIHSFNNIKVANISNTNKSYSRVHILMPFLISQQNFTDTTMYKTLPVNMLLVCSQWKSFVTDVKLRQLM